MSPSRRRQPVSTSSDEARSRRACRWPANARTVEPQPWSPQPAEVKTSRALRPADHRGGGDSASAPSRWLRQTALATLAPSLSETVPEGAGRDQPVSGDLPSADRQPVRGADRHRQREPPLSRRRAVPRADLEAQRDRARAGRPQYDGRRPCRALLLRTAEDAQRLLLRFPPIMLLPMPQAFQNAIAAGCRLRPATAVSSPSASRPTGHIPASDTSRSGLARSRRQTRRPLHREAAASDRQGLFRERPFPLECRHLPLHRPHLDRGPERHCPETLIAARDALRNAERDLDFIRLAAESFSAAQASRSTTPLSRRPTISLRATRHRLERPRLLVGRSGSRRRRTRTAMSRAATSGISSPGTARSTPIRRVAVVGVEDADRRGDWPTPCSSPRRRRRSRSSTSSMRLERDGRYEAIVHQRVHRPWGWYERAPARQPLSGEMHHGETGRPAVAAEPCPSLGALGRGLRHCRGDGRRHGRRSLPRTSRPMCRSTPCTALPTPASFRPS